MELTELQINELAQKLSDGFGISKASFKKMVETVTSELSINSKVLEVRKCGNNTEGPSICIKNGHHLLDVCSSCETSLPVEERMPFLQGMVDWHNSQVASNGRYKATNTDHHGWVVSGPTGGWVARFDGGGVEEGLRKRAAELVANLWNHEQG